MIDVLLLVLSAVLSNLVSGEHCSQAPLMSSGLVNISESWKQYLGVIYLNTE